MAQSPMKAASKRETRPKNVPNDVKHSGGKMGRGSTSTTSTSTAKRNFSHTGMSKSVKRMR